MLNFDFYNPVRIFFGRDRLEAINSQVPADASVLITYGGGSAKRSGLIDKVKSVLGSRRVYEFGGIEPNPRFETLVKAASLVCAQKIDYIIAVGGGSVIDGTKFIAISAHYKGDRLELLKFGLKNETKPVPFGAVLTLPAAGSEMNRGAVISHGNGKFGVFSEFSFPKFSILDPAYTYTLPKIQVANGIIDTFVHTTEQYITYPVDARLQDRMAEGILTTLIEISETAIAEPENYDARANLVWCAAMALNGLIGAGVPQDWTTHMIGHELTALLGIDHGQTLAIIYPAVLEVRRTQKREKLLQYAERIWHITDKNEEEKIDKAIKKTREFFESLGIKTRLSQYNVKEDVIPVILDQLKEHRMTALSETKDLGLEVSREILEHAM